MTDGAWSPYINHRSLENSEEPSATPPNRIEVEKYGVALVHGVRLVKSFRAGLASRQSQLEILHVLSREPKTVWQIHDELGSRFECKQIRRVMRAYGVPRVLLLDPRRSGRRPHAYYLPSNIAAS